MEKVKVEFEIGKTLNWAEISDYARYSEERNYANKTKFWGAIVSNYKTAKLMERLFLNSSIENGLKLIDLSFAKTHDVLQIRFDVQRSGKYTDRFEVNAVVQCILEDEIELTFFDTLFDAVKFQRNLKKIAG